MKVLTVTATKDAETKLSFSTEFLDMYDIYRLDVLQDMLNEITALYNETLKGLYNEQV